jgi:acetylglutamate kinase
MKQRIVIKLGGASLDNPKTLGALAELVRGYQKRRYNVVLVHGGGPAINQELTARGITWSFFEGQRQTTPEMMDVIDEVLSVKVNSRIFESLRLSKIAATGLSGAKHNILSCVQLNEQLGQVGEVKAVDVGAIEACFTTLPCSVPVIAPIGGSTSGLKYNVNADWAATQIAIALKAKKLIFLTDQNGILDENKMLVKKVNSRMIQKMIDEGVISGGMCTKVRAMMTALQEGVKKVRVLNAANAANLLEALTNDELRGTLLVDPRAQSLKEGLQHVQTRAS